MEQFKKINGIDCQAFNCPENGTNWDKFSLIYIPLKCDTCSKKLIVSGSYNSRGASCFRESCEHYASYDLVWNSRIEEKILIKSNSGLNCSSCKEYYPYASSNREDGTLLCYSCKLWSNN
jgi:hypothetical protein